MPRLVSAAISALMAIAAPEIAQSCTEIAAVFEDEHSNGIATYYQFIISKTDPQNSIKIPSSIKTLLCEFKTFSQGGLIEGQTYTLCIDLIDTTDKSKIYASCTG